MKVKKSFQVATLNECVKFQIYPAADMVHLVDRRSDLIKNLCKKSFDAGSNSNSHPWNSEVKIISSGM